MKSAGLALGVSVALLLGVPAALACNFEYDPVSTQQYYREQGWILPGVKDLHPAARAGARRGGLVAQDIPLDESQNVVEFPAQEFVVQGKRQRMRASQAQISVQRWVMRGRTIAYSYEMNPVTARRRGGKWVVESGLMCDFSGRLLSMTRATASFVSLCPLGCVRIWSLCGQNGTRTRRRPALPTGLPTRDRGRYTSFCHV